MNSKLPWCERYYYTIRITTIIIILILVIFGILETVKWIQHNKKYKAMIINQEEISGLYLGNIDILAGTRMEIYDLDKPLLKGSEKAFIFSIIGKTKYVDKDTIWVNFYKKTVNSSNKLICAGKIYKNNYGKIIIEANKNNDTKWHYEYYKKLY